MPREIDESYEFGNFRLDVGEHKLSRLDGRVNGSIPEKAFQTLVHLVRNPGTLITKDELLQAVWRDVVVEENNLVKAIYAIRRCLDDVSEDPKYIETVPKHGYRFVAQVKRIDGGAESVGSAAEPALTPEADDGQQPRSSSRPLIALGVTVGLAVLALAAVIALRQFGPNDARDDLNPTTAVAETAVSADSKIDDLYFRGKVKVNSENREDTEAGIKLLEEAVRLDPTLAPAYAQLARGYNTMAFKYSTGPESKRFHENSEVAIEKALALNPNLAEAHFARGLILWSANKGFPHEQAIRSYRRSVELDSNSDETHHQLSLVYSHIGLMDEADRSVVKALELNPNNTLARFRAGVYRQYRGRFDEAVAAFKSVPRDHTPLLTDRSLAETLIQMGRDSEALPIVEDYLRRFPQDDGGSFTSVKALLLARAGHREDAIALSDRAASIGRGFGHFHHTAYNIASVYAVLNEAEKATEWLQVAADTGFPNYPYFLIDPNLNPIRGHAKFKAFMEEQKALHSRFRTLAQE